MCFVLFGKRCDRNIRPQLCSFTAYWLNSTRNRALCSVVGGFFRGKNYYLFRLRVLRPVCYKDVARAWQKELSVGKQQIHFMRKQPTACFRLCPPSYVTLGTFH